MKIGTCLFAYHKNVAFSDEATIISSTKTRNTMVGEGLLRLQRMKNTMMDQANDPRKKLNLSVDNTEKLGIEK